MSQREFPNAHVAIYQHWAEYVRDWGGDSVQMAPQIEKATEISVDLCAGQFPNTFRILDEYDPQSCIELLLGLEQSCTDYECTDTAVDICEAINQMYGCVSERTEDDTNVQAEG